MRKKKNIFSRGMTYVELIVVLSIFSIMTSVVMFKFNDFNDSISIQNLSSQVAQQIVQAQKESVSGNTPKAVISIPINWKPSYGVFFNSALPYQFVYFADTNPDYIFNDTSYTGSCSGNPLDECLSVLSITKGNKIDSICLNKQSNLACTVSVSDMSVTFRRPDSQAVIRSSSFNSPINNVVVTVSSPGGNITREIWIYPVGQISVQ